MAKENDAAQEKAFEESAERLRALNERIIEAQADFTREIARAASAQSRDLLK